MPINYLSLQYGKNKKKNKNRKKAVLGVKEKALHIRYKFYKL